MGIEQRLTELGQFSEENEFVWLFTGKFKSYWGFTWMLNSNCTVTVYISDTGFCVRTHDHKITAAGRCLGSLMHDAEQYFTERYGIVH